MSRLNSRLNSLTGDTINALQRASADNSSERGWLILAALLSLRQLQDELLTNNRLVAAD